MQQLIDYINRYVKLNQLSITEMYKLAKIERYAKNQMILESGKRCHKIWFIKSGMVRKFYLSDGKEITTWINCENEFFTSLYSYFHQTPSTEFLQACEATETISLTRENSEKLAKFPAFVTFSNLMMGDQFARIDRNSQDFNRLSAMEKYKYLQNTAPQIVKRAKLGYIASIMGISPETLSRIRK